MTKKTKAIFMLVLLFSGFTVRAQPVFSITTSPVDSVTMGQASPYGYIEMTSYLINQSAAPVSLSWQLITDTSTYADDWSFFSIADNFLVRSPMSGVFQHAVQATAPIAPGDSSDMRLFIHVPVTSPYGSTGLFKIKVFDSLQTQIDTMVYRICKGTGCTLPAYGPGGPSGTHDVSPGSTRISVYPNPVTDKVYVKLQDIKENPSDLSAVLFDYTGRLLFQQRLASAREGISLGTYSPGMYFIRLYQKGKYLGGQKIIKQ